jgi:ParB/RepB/Spo0J family partition protein
MELHQIPLDRIVLPAHLHRIALDPEALAALADSIRDHGLLNPITVDRDGTHFILRAGHRRLEACKMLGWQTIRAIVRDATPAQDPEAITWAENFHRQDLSPLEEARTLARILKDHGYTHQQLARMLHCSPAWIAGRLALLELPEDLQQLVHSGDLAIGTARQLGRVEDPQHRAYLLQYALRSGATEHVVADWVHAWEIHTASGAATPPPQPEMPDDEEPPRPTIPCATCGTTTDLHATRVLRICKDCYRMIHAPHAIPLATPAASTARPET